MRVTSDFFVSALVRRVFAAGGFAAIEKRGSPEAGAIFIRQRNRSGETSIFGPAPQSEIPDDGTDDRRFEWRLKNGDPEAADALLAKEQRYDSDLWIVEIEVDAISDLIVIAEG